MSKLPRYESLRLAKRRESIPNCLGMLRLCSSASNARFAYRIVFPPSKIMYATMVDRRQRNRSNTGIYMLVEMLLVPSRLHNCTRLSPFRTILSCERLTQLQNQQINTFKHTMFECAAVRMHIAHQHLQAMHYHTAHSSKDTVRSKPCLRRRDATISVQQIQDSQLMKCHIASMGCEN